LVGCLGANVNVTDRWEATPLRVLLFFIISLLEIISFVVVSGSTAVWIYGCGQVLTAGGSGCQLG